MEAPHPVVQIDVSQDNGIRGHPDVRGQVRDAVAEHHNVPLPAEGLVLYVHRGKGGTTPSGQTPACR